MIKYKHQQPKKPQHSPHAHREIIYGAKEQWVPDDDISPRLNDTGIKQVQGIVGSLLYYAHAVNNKLLATLSAISSQQAKATENTAKAVNQVLDYVATYPSDGITYRASNMVLAAHSDASFLTEPNSRSQAGAHIFLMEDDPIPWQNGPVHTLSHIMKFVMAAAVEAELTALYHTAQEMIPLQNALDEMGWPQPQWPVQTDNSTATGFIHDTIIQQRIKMIWMQNANTLAPVPGGTGTISFILGQRHIKYGGLSHQTPSAGLPHRPPTNPCRLDDTLRVCRGVAR